MSPDAVPVVPADEGSEGAALTPVTVGAHQTVRARPVPDNTQHLNISYKYHFDGMWMIVSDGS